MAATEIKIPELPAEVRAGVARDNSGSIKKVYKIDNSGIVSYRVVVSSWFKEKEVYYDGRGTFLK